VSTKQTSVGTDGGALTLQKSRTCWASDRASLNMYSSVLLEPQDSTYALFGVSVLISLRKFSISEWLRVFLLEERFISAFPSVLVLL
jgi:hypothetical protein